MVIWIVSPSDTLVTVPVTVRMGSRAKERDVKGRGVNPASRAIMRKVFMGDVFRGMVLPLRFIGSGGLRIGKMREDVNGISS